MAILRSIIGAVFVVALVLTTANGQTGGGFGGGGQQGGAQQGGGTQPQQQALCAQRFDGDLSPTCFDPQGLTFQGVLFLVTQNVSGTLPPGESVMSFRRKVCLPTALDFIIPCILQFKAQFTNETCTPEEVAMIDASGRQLLRMTEFMCMEPCEMNIRESLSECFVSAQINPARFLNTSMTQDKFPLIGNTSQEADRFCQMRTQLFTCLKQVVQTCPHALRSLYEMGIDVEALEATAEILCREKEIYMDAYRCFSTPNPGIGQCEQASFGELNEVVVGRMRTGTIRPSEFVIRLCAIRLRKVNCELQSFRQRCQPVQNELRNMAECTILPHICRDEPTFQTGLSQMCAAPTTPPPHKTTPKMEVTTPKRPHIVTKPTPGDNGSSTITVSGLLVSVAILFHVHKLF